MANLLPSRQTIRQSSTCQSNMLGRTLALVFGHAIIRKPQLARGFATRDAHVLNPGGKVRSRHFLFGHLFYPILRPVRPLRRGTAGLLPSQSGDQHSQCDSHLSGEKNKSSNFKFSHFLLSSGSSSPDPVAMATSCRPCPKLRTKQLLMQEKSYTKSKKRTNYMTVGVAA